MGPAEDEEGGGLEEEATSGATAQGSKLRHRQRAGRLFSRFHKFPMVRIFLKFLEGLPQGIHSRPDGLKEVAPTHANTPSTSMTWVAAPRQQPLMQEERRRQDGQWEGTKRIGRATRPRGCQCTHPGKGQGPSRSNGRAAETKPVTSRALKDEPQDLSEARGSTHL